MQTLRRSPLVVAILMIASSVVARPGRAADAAPSTLRSLTIVPEAASIDEGATAVFVAIGTYADGVRKDVTSKVRWSSSDRKLATVTGDGAAAGIRRGKVTIKVVIDKVEASAELTIQPRLTSLSVDPRATALTPPRFAALTANGT